MSTDIHTSSSTISEQAAESTFHEVDDRERAIPAIEFRNVLLAFDDRVILNRLNFKVMKGETKIILGGSGGGKSTIIKLVLGQGVALVSIGLLVGIAAALLATRLLATFLYHIRPNDPFSYTAMSVTYQRAGRIPEAEMMRDRAHMAAQHKH